MQSVSTPKGDRPKTAAVNRPAHTVRYGAIRAAIWKNVIDNGNTPRELYNVTLSRGYHDGKQWRASGSFGVEDLLVVAKAANEAHTWICQQRTATAQTDPEAVHTTTGHGGHDPEMPAGRA